MINYIHIYIHYFFRKFEAWLSYIFTNWFCIWCSI